MPKAQLGITYPPKPVRGEVCEQKGKLFGGNVTAGETEDDFSADEFVPSGSDEEENYPIHEIEICMINDLPDECIELGFDVYCEESYPNIPVEDFFIVLIRSLSPHG